MFRHDNLYKMILIDGKESLVVEFLYIKVYNYSELISNKIQKIKKN